MHTEGQNKNDLLTQYGTEYFKKNIIENGKIKHNVQCIEIYTVQWCNCIPPHVCVYDRVCLK